MAIVPRILHGKEFDIADEYELEWGKAYALEVDRLKNEREEEFGAAVLAKSVNSSSSRSMVIGGLLYGILVDSHHSAKYIKALGRVAGESYGEVVVLLKKLIRERFHRFLEGARVQLVWIVSSMIQLGVGEVDGLIIELIRQVPVGQSQVSSTVWLWSELLTLFSSFRSWIYSHPSLIPIIAYSIATLIPDHHRPEFDALREREIALLVQLVRERFDAIRTAGRDFIRVLYNISLIPEVKTIWEQVILSPIDPSTRDTNLKSLLTTPSPKTLLMSRLSPEMENWLTFVFTQVKAGPHSWYQKWFQAKFLSSTDCEPLVADLIRWIVSVHHPTNAILQSNILPRYKFIGWLIGACTRNPHFQNNARQALYYDWYFYQNGRDNIMTIEPGALLLMNTLQKDPPFVGALAEHIMIACDNYLVKDLPSLRDDMRKSVFQATRFMLEKKVISSFEPLYSFSHLNQSLREHLKKVFEGLSSKSGSSSTQNTHPTSKSSNLGSSAHPTAPNANSAQIPPKQPESQPTAHSTANSAHSTPNITPSSSTEIPIPSAHQRSSSSTSHTHNGHSAHKHPQSKDASGNLADLSSNASSSASHSASTSTARTGNSQQPISPALGPGIETKRGNSGLTASEAAKQDEYGTMFAGWKAALSSSASQSEGSSVSTGNDRSSGSTSSASLGQSHGLNASDPTHLVSSSPRGSVSMGGTISPSSSSSTSAMDIDRSDIRLSHEIVIASTPTTKYLEQILVLSKRVESGNMRLARKSLAEFLVSAAFDWASSPFSGSDLLELATKLLEILASELIEQWHGEQQRKLALPSPSDFVHTQLFQCFLENEEEEHSEAEKALVLALMQATRTKDASFGARFLCFLFATFQPSSTVDMTSINADANQDELFRALMQSEEEKLSLELRESDSLSMPPWIHPYTDFLTMISKSSNKKVGEVFLEDMTQLALSNVASFNSVVPLVCRYLPTYCLGSSPFVHLVLRTCLPQSMTALHGALSSQTFRLVGPNLTGILSDSLKWETFAQQLLWNMLTSEFLTQSEQLIEALAELLPKFQTSTASEAMQGSLTLISLIGPVPKLIQAVLSMPINSYEFTTSIWVRWMAEDEFQSELAKKLPTILNGLSKNLSKLRRAIMHLSLVYSAIPSDMDVLLAHGPLRRSLLTHFKASCTDDSFKTLRDECIQRDEKEKATETKRGSKKRVHEDDTNDETDDAKVPSPPPPNATPKTAPPKAKRKKNE